jgi:hypothetical protein
MYMVLSKGPPSASSLVKVHYLDSPLLAVDSAYAGDLLPSATTPELGYQHQIPDVLEAKMQSTGNFTKLNTLKADEST